MKISIIAPAHNEKNNICKFVEEVANVMSDLKLDYELVVIDDGSDDGTYSIVSLIARKNPKVRVIKNALNKGKGYSVRKGFEFSTGEIIVCVDVDMPMHPEQLAYYLRKLKVADIVIASKRHSHSSVNYSLLRSFLSRCFSVIVKAMFRLHLSDTQCGFKLFKIDVSKKLVPKLLVDRFAFDVELLVNADRRGYSVVEVPITLKHYEATFSIKEIFWMFIDLLAIFYRLHFTKIYDR